MNQEMPTFDVTSIPTDFNPLQTLDGGNTEALYAKDNALFVQFHTQAVLHPAKSTQAGRPIYDDVDMITIRTPGSNLSSVVAPAKYYLDRFGDKYRTWKSGQMEAASGTPLENFPFLFTKPSLIAELKYRNIFTVEQLADMSDTAKQSVMGGHELCKKASEWINKTASDAVDAEKEDMKKQLAEMKILLESLTEAKPAPAAAAKPAPAAAKPAPTK